MSEEADEHGAHERDWAAGHRAAYESLLADCLRQLGDDAPDAARLTYQLEQVRRKLREICAEHGDNDWPDSLSLADVIEKHLWRHLPDR